MLLKLTSIKFVVTPIYKYFLEKFATHLTFSLIYLAENKRMQPTQLCLSTITTSPWFVLTIGRSSSLPFTTFGEHLPA